MDDKITEKLKRLYYEADANQEAYRDVLLDVWKHFLLNLIEHSEDPVSCAERLRERWLSPPQKTFASAGFDQKKDAEVENEYLKRLDNLTAMLLREARDFKKLKER